MQDLKEQVELKCVDDIILKRISQIIIEIKDTTHTMTESNIVHTWSDKIGISLAKHFKVNFIREANHGTIGNELFIECNKPSFLYELIDHLMAGYKNLEIRYLTTPITTPEYYDHRIYQYSLGAYRLHMDIMRNIGTYKSFFVRPILNPLTIKRTPFPGLLLGMETDNFMIYSQKKSTYVTATNEGNPIDIVNSKFTNEYKDYLRMIKDTEIYIINVFSKIPYQTVEDQVNVLSKLPQQARNQLNKVLIPSNRQTFIGNTFTNDILNFELSKRKSNFTPRQEIKKSKMSQRIGSEQNLQAEVVEKKD